MARDAALQRQELAEELFLRSSGQLEIEAVVRFAQRRGQRDRKKAAPAPARNMRVQAKHLRIGEIRIPAPPHLQPKLQNCKMQ